MQLSLIVILQDDDEGDSYFSPYKCHRHEYYIYLQSHQNQYSKAAAKLVGLLIYALHELFIL